MNFAYGSEDSPPLALEPFEPEPGSVYSLDITAHLTGVSRRSILLYCRSGLIDPVIQPPYGALCFDDQSIHAIRTIEYLRNIHGINLSGIRLIFNLAHEVERLRDEMRFFRGH